MRVVAERSLLDRRLVIVTGKGGTGKTTVAAALAIKAAETGQRVALVEMGRDEQIRELLAPGSTPVGYEGRDLLLRLRVFHIDPFACLSEYLRLQIGMGRLVEMTLRNTGFRQLLSGMPGWRELVMLGKIWHLTQLERHPGKPLYDLVVVDAPASGHGLTFLEVPSVARSAVRAGPMRRHAGQVEDLVQDPERTLLLPVTLAEELPTVETIELIERVASRIGTPIDRVVVNSVEPPPYPDEFEELPRWLDALPDSLGFGALPTTRLMAACCRARWSRHELNREYVAAVSHKTGLPAVILPHIAGGVRGPDALRDLGERLLTASAGGRDA